ncbi:MAG: hypothetical protein ACXWKC_05560 [Xanthobacteraceae bacterium]
MDDQVSGFQLDESFAVQRTSKPVSSQRSATPMRTKAAASKAGGSDVGGLRRPATRTHGNLAVAVQEETEWKDF